MVYASFTHSELNELIEEPWEVADRPHLLFASYAISCLSEALTPDNDDDEPQPIWGQRIPITTLDSLVRNISEAFNDAADNGGKIDINNRVYAVRRADTYDHNSLQHIFDFKTEGDEYIISKDGIKNLSRGKDEHEPTEKEKLELNRNFLRAVVMIAEDDEHDGWNKLTDMEVIVYCWSKFYTERESNVEDKFYDEYKDFMYAGKRDIRNCWTDVCQRFGRPNGLYTFDKMKVERWNNEHHQKSIVSNINQEDAADYWYARNKKGKA